MLYESFELEAHNLKKFQYVFGGGGKCQVGGPGCAECVLLVFYMFSDIFIKKYIFLKKMKYV